MNTDQELAIEKERAHLVEEFGNLKFIYSELSQLHRLSRKSEIFSLLKTKELLSYREIAMKIVGLSGNIDTEEILAELSKLLANKDKLIRESNIGEKL